MLILSKCDQPDCDGVLAYDKGVQCNGKGCDEPCSFRMAKSGHGVPPFPVDWQALLLKMLVEVYDSEYGWGIGPTESEMRDLIAAAKDATS